MTLFFKIPLFFFIVSVLLFTGKAVMAAPPSNKIIHVFPIFFCRGKNKTFSSATQLFSARLLALWKLCVCDRVIDQHSHICQIEKKIMTVSPLNRKFGLYCFTTSRVITVVTGQTSFFSSSSCFKYCFPVLFSMFFYTWQLLFFKVQGQDSGESCYFREFLN